MLVAVTNQASAPTLIALPIGNIPSRFFRATTP